MGLVQIFLLRQRISYCIWSLIQQGKWQNAWLASLNFGGKISLIWGEICFIYQVTHKAASCNWDSDQDKAPKEFQDVVQISMPLGPYIPADPIVLEVSLAGRNAVWNFWKLLEANGSTGI